MKPVLKYPGSKWRIAGEIVARIPEHHTYLEPFFGSGAVFFSKEPSRIEMINDLDNNVPNLFRCIGMIRTDWPELLRQRLIPDMSMRERLHRMRSRTISRERLTF